MKEALSCSRKKENLCKVPCVLLFYFYFKDLYSHPFCEMQLASFQETLVGGPRLFSMGRVSTG